MTVYIVYIHIEYSVQFQLRLFDRVYIWFTWKEPLSILTNRGVINDKLNNPHYQYTIMINPLGDTEEHDEWKEDFSLDNHYEIDYPRGDRYEWIFNSLNK